MNTEAARLRDLCGDGSLDDYWPSVRIGDIRALLDERDALRECILRALPRDLVDKARAWCKQTLLEGEKDEKGRPRVAFADRVRGMVLEFERIGVTREKLEAYAGVKVDLGTPEKFADLTKVFVSIRDGHTTAEEWFDPKGPVGETGTTASAMREQAKARKAAATPAPAAEGGAS